MVIVGFIVTKIRGHGTGAKAQKTRQKKEKNKKC
jgi:hypothetical protein